MSIPTGNSYTSSSHTTSRIVFALIRHGDYHQPKGVPSAHLPFPLTDIGRQQSRKAAEQLLSYTSHHNLPFHAQIDCSPMLRAWETAELIREAIREDEPHLKVEEYPQLCERSVGTVANLTVAEIEQVIKDDPRYPDPPVGWKSSSDYCLPFMGAESLNQAGLRVAQHLQTIQDNVPSEDERLLKVVVGHGASLRHGAMHLGILTPENVGRVSMFHATPVFIACINGQWTHIGGDWKQRKYDQDGDEIRV